MKTVHTLTLGSYQTNTYVVENEGHCVIIDPGYEPETIEAFLQKHNLTVDAICLTHGHFDHVGAVKILAADLDCPVYIHEAELALPSRLTGGPLYYTNLYGEGDTVAAAGLQMQVLHTPGHTPGCVCLLVEDFMFSGDTLFAGSCGRTDLPGGSWGEIQRSLQRLAALEKNYAVFPGHAESTTLAMEKQYNPYMR